MKTAHFVLALTLYACGGSDFSSTFAANSPEADADGGGDAAVPDTLAPEADAGSDAALGDPDTGVTSDGATVDPDAGSDAPTSEHDGGHHDATQHDATPPPPPCDGAGLSTHQTGVGQTWNDCVPVGTHTTAQALQACATWCAAKGGCDGACFTGNVCNGSFVLGQVGDTAMTGWAVNGDTVKVNPNTQSSCSHVGSWD